jgi:hypothetical protein
MQIEIYEPGPFCLAFGLGLLLGLGWCALYVLSWAWSWSWAWIDDSEAPKANPLISFVMRRMGWADGDRWFRFRKGDQISDGASGFFYPLLALLFGPALAVLAVTIYPATLAALTLFLLARLARFARRHKKLFDKHIVDPNAHIKR